MVNRQQAAVAAGGSGMNVGIGMRYPGQGVMNGTPPLDPGAVNGGAMAGTGNVLGPPAGVRKASGPSPLPFGLPQGKPGIPEWQKALNAVGSGSGGGSGSGEVVSGESS